MEESVYKLFLVDIYGAKAYNIIVKLNISSSGQGARISEIPDRR